MNTANLTVATEISNQLGRRAFAMMGAKDLLAIESGVQFAVGTNAKKISKIRIVLDPSDTYTVTFYTGKGIGTVRFNAKTGEMQTVGGLREVSSISDVYAENLHSVIENATGLYLAL